MNSWTHIVRAHSLLCQSAWVRIAKSFGITISSILLLFLDLTMRPISLFIHPCRKWVSVAPLTLFRLSIVDTDLEFDIGTTFDRTKIRGKCVIR